MSGASNEIWTPIEETNGVYLVSNKGRVMSKKKYKDGVILKPYYDTCGYAYVEIDKKNVSMHRLVAKAYIDNPENKKEVNHINGDKKDNRAENLEWCTRSENISHAFKSGLKQALSRGKHLMAKGVVCLETGEAYECMEDAAEATGAKAANISKCCRGLRKTAASLHWKYARG